ncbi:hypothetical protein [Acaryochloris sp. IP29b_bin.148]|uniref:hypothetical protein n=1 Tax=Acaryochloris sp. IP29b_bin.148 TaxID=2969218 RepID=UPI00262A1355|nr:hypothetical protein [Acaryochloris sp. IP29b_bin.148]
MSILQFIKEYGAGVGGTVVALGSLLGLVWFLFRSAVAAATKHQFVTINQKLDAITSELQDIAGSVSTISSQHPAQ